MIVGRVRLQEGGKGESVCVCVREGGREGVREEETARARASASEHVCVCQREYESVCV